MERVVRYRLPLPTHHSIACTIERMRRFTPFFLLVLSFELSARQPVHARHAMVVAQEPLAADVGVAVLKSGGNAIDAAVAVGFALAVTHPFAGNLGGGGFMLIRLADGRTTFIDFRERAPEGLARYVSRRERQADARQHRRLALLGRARHRARLRAGAAEIRAQEMGRRDGARDRARVQGISGQLFARRIAERLAQSWRDIRNRSASFRRTAHYYEMDDTFKQPDLARDAGAHRQERREGILRRRDGAEIRRGDGQKRRPDHAGRSEELRGRGAQARSPANIENYDIITVASAQLRRHRDSADAGDARRLRL